MMSQDPLNYDYLAKVAILGESSVGKSAIVLQFCEKIFGSEIPTTLGIEFRVKFLEADGKKVKLHVWDTAGQERFRTMHRGYYRIMMGILLCYAINNRESFERIGYWMEEIRKYASADVCVVLVGNKSDLPDERVVSLDEGRQLADSLGIKFFETSAKEDINIDEAYLALVKDIIVKGLGNEKNEDRKLLYKENNSEGKTGCFKCS